MKKYRIGDVYILDVAKVNDYTYPNWYERITHSKLLSHKVVAVMVYDKSICQMVYVTGTGVKIFGRSYDTKSIGDLFVKGKTAIGLTKAAATLPKKITVEWMNEFQKYLIEEDEKVLKTQYVEDILIEHTIQTIEEYIAETVEYLQKPRANRKNFNCGKLEAYEDCIKLLRNLVKKENKNEDKQK